MENDDIFHNVTMSEEICHQKGFAEGKKVGEQKGLVEGQKLGWEKGAAIGSEVGFYSGFAESLLEEMKKEPETKQRAVKTLERILSVCREFPLTEPQNPELPTRLEELRSKFKQVCSQLGIKADAQKPDVKGVSF
ncbi:hypothetical protein DPMN_013336 [Dreissena polymorpha]|uniref:Oral cancer-overexpressed protein 1 n=2 Tax=Dreissena polymorpha TaxID=45954 RepID=A0A9D4N7H7_DREPO|nr:hypothetical protein DPMN_013336 [Dreissena polymorpha]